MVGVVSDSYFVAAELLRRRVFADFALAHTLQFDGDVCNGRLKINPAFQQIDPALGPAICKSNVLARFLEDDKQPRVTETWAVGDNVNDIGLLRRVDRAFAMDPKAPEVLRVPGIVRVESFADLVALTADVPADPVAA
jgi:phosphoserine phosphatase